MPSQFDVIEDFFRPREIRLPHTGMQRRGRPSLSNPEMEVEQDPSLELFTTQSFLNDRMEEDMLSALKAGDLQDAVGLQQFLSGNAREMEQGVVGRQRHEVDALERRGKEAILQGFADPSDPTFVGDGGFAEPIQRQSEAARAMAAFEANKGVREAQAKAQGDVAVEVQKQRGFENMLRQFGLLPEAPTPQPTINGRRDVTQEARAMAEARRNGGTPPTGGNPGLAGRRPTKATVGMTSAGPTLNVEMDNTAQLQGQDMIRRLQNINTTLDQMIGDDGEMHPGFFGAIGAPSAYDIGSWNRLRTGYLSGEGGKSFGGSNAATFEGFLDTLDSQLGFIEAQKSLKGFGPMSNLELQAARNSINYLRQTQSEDEFMRMVPEVEAVVERLSNAIEQESGLSMPHRTPRLGGQTITDPTTGKTYRIKR
jgi:hypothetical protein